PWSTCFCCSTLPLRSGPRYARPVPSPTDQSIRKDRVNRQQRSPATTIRYSGWLAATFLIGEWFVPEDGLLNTPVSTDLNAFLPVRCTSDTPDRATCWLGQGQIQESHVAGVGL